MDRVAALTPEMDVAAEAAHLPRPRAILFDWDNTLVNTWPTIVECYHDTFTALGMTPWTATEVQDRAHGSLREIFPTLFGPRAGEAERVFYDTFRRIHLERLEPLAGADTLLLTVPNQLGVEYNAHVIEAILTQVAPGLGWR